MQFPISPGTNISPQVRRRGEILPPLPYGKFAEAMSESYVRKATDIAYITFNYDVGLDCALLRRGHPDYCLGKGAATSGPPLLKLHGSLNWTCCDECQNIVAHDMARIVKNHEIFSDTERKFTQIRVTSSIEDCPCAYCKAKPVEVPVIVPPTWNKGPYYKLLAPVWKAAAKHLSEAENIIIIGYSRPDTDQFFRHLFALGTIGAARIRRIVVIDKDPKVKCRFKEILGGASNDCFIERDDTNCFSEAIPFISSLFRHE